jgi:hypothetical protein
VTAASLDDRRKIRSLPPLVAETALLILRIYPEAKITAHKLSFTARLVFAPPLDARHPDEVRKLKARVEMVPGGDGNGDPRAYISISVPSEPSLWYWCETPTEAVSKIPALVIFALPKYGTEDT